VAGIVSLALLDGNTATFEDLGQYSTSLVLMERTLEEAVGQVRRAEAAAEVGCCMLRLADSRVESTWCLVLALQTTI
jgi:hypothetical protein